MREIKFRAWDYKNGQMLKITSIVYTAIWNPNKINFIEGRNKKHDFFSLKFEDIDIMQYTGLKDCNGIEIYEGDILKDCGFVVWVEKDKRFGLNILEELNEITFDELQEKELEIIGNIYDNPELAEK